MPPTLSANTQSLVEKIFDENQVGEATQWLEDECGNNLPGCRDYDEHQIERIRFAVLKLSEGTIHKLLRAIDLARTDWRDLLMVADFGTDVGAHTLWAEDFLKK